MLELLIMKELLIYPDFVVVVVSIKVQKTFLQLVMQLVEVEFELVE